METIFREYLEKYAYSNMIIDVCNDIVCIEDRDIVFCINRTPFWIRGEDALEIAAALLDPSIKYNDNCKLSKNIYDYLCTISHEKDQVIINFKQIEQDENNPLLFITIYNEEICINNKDIPVIAATIIKYARHALKNNMISHQSVYMRSLASNAIYKGIIVKLDIKYLKDADKNIYCTGFREFQLNYLDKDDKVVYSFDRIIYPPVFKEEFDYMIKGLTAGNKIPYSMDKWDFDETRANFDARCELDRLEREKCTTENIGEICDSGN